MTGEEEKNTEMQVRISARLSVLKNLAREKGDSALVEKIEEELEWLCSLFDSEQAEKDSRMVIMLQIQNLWKRFRREAAKDILYAVINGRISEDVSFAIKYADELIKQLKEK